MGISPSEAKKMPKKEALQLLATHKWFMDQQKPKNPKDKNELTLDQVKNRFKPKFDRNKIEARKKRFNKNE